MKYVRPQIRIGKQLFDILSFEEFKAKKGLQDTPNPTISYNLNQGHLDYTIIGHIRFIIWNHKAKNFSLVNRRPRLKK